MLGTIVSVVGGLNGAIGMYRGINSLVHGDSTEQYLQRIEKELVTTKLEIQKLGENIVYVANRPSVFDATRPESDQQIIHDLSAIKNTLEPIQQAIGNRILASSIITAPARLTKAMESDPFGLLVDVRPLRRATQSQNMIPLLFQDGTETYLGWQTEGALRQLVDCSCDQSWLSPASVAGTPTLPSQPIDKSRVYLLGQVALSPLEIQTFANCIVVPIFVENHAPPNSGISWLDLSWASYLQFAGGRYEYVESAEYQGKHHTFGWGNKYYFSVLTPDGGSSQVLSLRFPRCYGLTPKLCLLFRKGDKVTLWPRAI